MNTNEAQPSAQEQLAIVVDILAATAERAQLLHAGIIGAVLVEPLATIDPVEIQLAIRQTIAAGSEIMERLGGVSLIHTDDNTGQVQHNVAYRVVGYNAIEDTWAFASNPFGMTAIQDAYIELRLTTPEFRQAHAAGQLSVGLHTPLHPREP